MCPEDEGLLESPRSAKPDAYNQARWEERLLKTTTSGWGAVGPPRARDRPGHAPSPEPTLPSTRGVGRAGRRAPASCPPVVGGPPGSALACPGPVPAVGPSGLSAPLTWGPQYSPRGLQLRHMEMPSLERRDDCLGNDLLGEGATQMRNVCDSYQQRNCCSAPDLTHSRPHRKGADTPHPTPSQVCSPAARTAGHQGRGQVQGRPGRGKLIAGEAKAGSAGAQEGKLVHIVPLP